MRKRSHPSAGVRHSAMEHAEVEEQESPRRARRYLHLRHGQRIILQATRPLNCAIVRIVARALEVRARPEHCPIAIFGEIDERHEAVEEAVSRTQAGEAKVAIAAVGMELLCRCAWFAENRVDMIYCWLCREKMASGTDDIRQPTIHAIVRVRWQGVHPFDHRRG